MQNRMLRAVAALVAIGFVAACEAPAPAVSNGVAPDVAASSPNTPKQAAAAEREARQIVVQPGQSLSRIAANGLSDETMLIVTPKHATARSTAEPCAGSAPPLFSDKMFFSTNRSRSAFGPCWGGWWRLTEAPRRRER